MILSIMALHWTTIHAVLWTILYLFAENVSVSPCAEVNSSSTLVPSGSAVTASCYIKEDCSLTKTQDFLIKWKKNSHFISSCKGNLKNIYELIILNFTDTKAQLECLICEQDNCNVVGAVEIRAVYPPSVPQNLSCLISLNEPITLLCTWDPCNKISDNPTNYTLHTEFRYLNKLQCYSYIPPPEETFYRVPRDGFTLLHEVKIYVIATNALGQATSNVLMLDPLKTAKLDAPVIQGVGTQTFGCLEYKWSLSHAQNWILKTLYVEIQYKPVNNKDFITAKFYRKPQNKVKICNLLHGMSYKAQMRIRYQVSSPWSEWSNDTLATTPMKAPTGQLDTWLKLKSPENTVELFWKPTLQFCANSMSVSYNVSLTGKFTKKREIVCVTKQQHCSFKIHAKVRKVYLTAINEAGKSNPIEVPVYRTREMDPVPFLTILPQSEEALLAKWNSPDTSTTSSAYVLEWKALCGTNAHHVFFEIMDRNQTSFVLPGLEPYIPYEISVYPKYGDGFGRPYTTVAYTKQKAPRISPKLKIGKISHTFVELSWDEIPLQQRNGIITGYKIFYKDQENNTIVRDTPVTERHIVLKELYPFTIYEIFLMTSTYGGSLNGPTVTVKTASIDALEIVLIVIPACVGFLLFFFGMFTCVVKQKWMKKYVWPVIPDPANSNIRKWTTADSLECIPPFKETKDPVLVYLSHLSLLSLPEKELSKGNSWTYNVNTGHDDSSHESESFDSEEQNESVPYATVVFAGPYRRQPVPQPVYLRSESTQPLLGEEEPSSPRPYEKVTNQANSPDVRLFHKNASIGEEKVSLWENFPMLSSIEINSKT